MHFYQRREFITLLSGAAIACPRSSLGQQNTAPVVGFLSSASPDLYVERLRAFQQGLGETNHLDNVTIEQRWAADRYDRLPKLADDLVRRNAVVIVAAGTAATWAVKRATAVVPVVFVLGADPVKAGIVANLGRPGGNLTGATNLDVELSAKRLEVLHELLPGATTIGALVNPASPNADTVWRNLRAAAQALGVEVHVAPASNEGDLRAAFEDLSARRIRGLVINADAFFNGRSTLLAAMTIEHRIPTVFQFHDFVTAGGLMSYGGNVTEAYRLAGTYVGRILDGEKPADLPVQQTTKVELIINLKAAKALGLDVPATLLARADEVIE